jgi:hypothetical protein|tara:strand:- start:543 stop:716 length:174 start_codon:yes stop_codon:yes gene_type:complete
MPKKSMSKKKKQEPLNGRQNIRLDESMLEKVTVLAMDEERSVSSMLRILVREGLDQR